MKRKSLLRQIRGTGSLPPPSFEQNKRLKGRVAVKRCQHQLSGVGSVQLATLVLDKTGFLDRDGGGEPGIPVLIASFLQGWVPILLGLVRLQVLNPRARRMMARFACTPTRLMVDPVHNAIRPSGTRCRDPSCIFRDGPEATKGHYGTKCVVTHADNLWPPQMRELLLAVPAEKWCGRIPGDTIDFAQRVVKGWLDPLVERFAATDTAREERLRIGLPPPSAWNGVQFHISDTYRTQDVTVVDTKVNTAGRVVGLLLHVGTNNGNPEWCKLVGYKNGWVLQIHHKLRLPVGWGTPRQRIPAFPHVTFYRRY